MADNELELTEEVETEDTEIADGEVEFEDQDVDAKDSEVDKTKAFAQRLKDKTREIEEKAEKTIKEEKDRIAKLKGFQGWDEFEKAIQNDAMIEMGVEDPARFEKFMQEQIEKNPIVLKAQAVLKQQEEEQQNRYVEEQVKSIGEVDKSIKTLDDIMKLDNYQDIYAKVQKGYSLYDAFVLCSLDKISGSKVDAAKKQTIDDITNKGHLKKAAGVGGSDTFVPNAVMAIYKRNLPKWTEEQIRDHYEKSLEGDHK